MKKTPKTILTDQDLWMKEAISKDLSSTKHGFAYGTSLLSLVLGLMLYFEKKKNSNKKKKACEDANLNPILLTKY